MKFWQYKLFLVSLIVTWNLDTAFMILLTLRDLLKGHVTMLNPLRCGGISDPSMTLFG